MLATLQAIKFVCSVVFFVGKNMKNGKQIKKEVYINNDTGEYKEKTRYVDMLYSKRGYIFKYNNTYMKLFVDKTLPGECSLKDCGKFYRLTKYIKENQLLGYRTNSIKPLTFRKITEIFNCDDRQTRNFIQKMKNLKVIKEVKINGVEWYAVNPLYALKGKYLTVTTFIIFQDELIGVLPRWVINNFVLEVKEITDKIEIERN